MEILNDFNTSVEKSLTEIDPKWKDYRGLIVCGTHSPHNWDEQILKIQRARENGIAFLGICFGHQLAAIEYARNVLGVKNATSEEFKPEGTDYSDLVVLRRVDGLKVGLHDGESYWNKYEVKSELEDLWQKADNFITVQYHPEYQSSIDKPHPILVKFLQYARGK